MSVNLATMHPRQAAVLEQVPEADRSAVLSHAHFLQNVSGGNLSGALYTARQHYQRLGAEKMLESDRAFCRSHR